MRRFRPGERGRGEQRRRAGPGPGTGRADIGTAYEFRARVGGTAAPDSAPDASAPGSPAAPRSTPPADEAAGLPPRRKRHRRRRLVLIIVAAVIVILIAGSYATAEYTSRTPFCNTCHEMNPYYASWEASVHDQVECVQCHIPPGVIPFTKTKLFSFREIWVHITGTPTAPLAVTREIPSSNCLSCHPNPGDATLGDVAFSHDAHAAESCVDCHVRLVHRTVNPPDYVPPAEMSSCLVCHDGTIASSECSYCHQPPHEPRGECSNCHNQDSWIGALADHPFPLVGADARLTCTDCHASQPGVEKIPGTELFQADPACVSCHGDHPRRADRLRPLPHAGGMDAGRVPASLRPGGGPRQPHLHRLPCEQAGRRERSRHSVAQGRPRLRLVPRGPPRRVDRLRPLPHAGGMDAGHVPASPGRRAYPRRRASPRLLGLSPVSGFATSSCSCHGGGAPGGD